MTLKSTWKFPKLTTKLRSMQQYGESWFDKLLEQNPRWVRGTATPSTILSTENATEAATFTSHASPYTPSNTSTTVAAFPEEGYRAAQEMRADGYIECSAATGELLRLAFEEICRAAVKTASVDGSGGAGGGGGCVIL